MSLNPRLISVTPPAFAEAGFSAPLPKNSRKFVATLRVEKTSLLNIFGECAFKPAMQRSREKVRLPQVLALAIVVICFCGLGVVAGCDGKTGRIYSPPIEGNPAHPPAVLIFAPGNGAIFHAHADIHLLALATPYGTSLGPDEDAARRFADTAKWNLRQDPVNTVSVEFLAGTNSLGSRISGMVSAGVRSQPGEATPMIVTPVGYPAVELIWSNAPAGTYTLTARATNKTGLVTVSAPASITVAP